MIIEMTGSPKPRWATKELFLEEANKHVEVKAGKLTKATDFLICSDYADTSSKMKKAEELGVKIITYSDFIKEIIK
jgi:NAD-dependent DNA ligase